MHPASGVGGAKFGDGAVERDADGQLLPAGPLGQSGDVLAGCGDVAGGLEHADGEPAGAAQGDRSALEQLHRGRTGRAHLGICLEAAHDENATARV